MSGSRSVERVAREIADLRRIVFALATQPQLPYSSVDGGALQFNDNTGAITAIFGQQFDGTNGAAAVNGPTPPNPMAPVAVAAINGAVVHWNGLWEDGAVTPMDFARVEIHAVDDDDDIAADAESIVGTYDTPRGGYIYVPISGPKYFKLVARSTTGKASDPSQPSDDISPITVDLPPSDAPTTSPDPVVIPIPGALLIQVDEIADGERFEYHVYTDSGYDPTAGGDTHSMIADLPSPGYMATRLADDSPLVPGTTYYVKTYAHNQIGYAATTSTEVSVVAS